MESQKHIIKLIVGLGNPGPSYEDTRHNAGFWFVNQIAAEHNETLRAENKFDALVGKVNIAGHNVILLLPQTFMNASGMSVCAAAKFYKIKPEEILVVHDEIDLPPGTVRFKFGGGHGGHNGLRDIIKALGSNDFYRLRIGVGKAKHKDDVADYVLKRPNKTEQQVIDDAMFAALRVLPDVVDGDVELAMKELHTQNTGT